VEPDAFLDYVHDIDHSPVPADPRLDAALHALPGRKLIFTNGTVAHAEKVLARLGVTHHFGDIFDIVHSDFVPKPEMEPYRKFVSATGVRTETAAMFEDIARNLEAPHALGMTTVLVVSPDNHDARHLNGATGGTGQPHIDHVTSDLPGFLDAVARARQKL
jgi:putative hydrolase of the HAD superfamily